MDHWDIKKVYKTLYAPGARDFVLVDVPGLSFLMIDGSGDPNTSQAYASAVQTLYTVAYGVRAIARSDFGRIHTVAPLEGLWHADDPTVFASGNRSAWQWTMMIAQPDWITREIVSAALERTRKQTPAESDLVRFERFSEGLAVQILHVGPYEAEGPTIARLHSGFLPANGLTPTGKHHEVYLSDPRRTAPEKLKTILRQPVERIG